MKIAILTPGDLPIPSIKGGAIETLCTHLIFENEKETQPFEFYIFNQDVFINSAYKNTKIVNIRTKHIIALIYDLFFILLFKYKKKNRYWNTYYTMQCLKVIKKEGINIVLVEGNYTQVIQLKKHGVRNVVLHLHTDILKNSTILSKETTNDCTSIIVVSEFLKKRMLEIDSSNKDKTFVLKNVIDSKMFRKTLNENELENLRLKYKINKQTKVLLYVGRISVEKGVRELIKAYNLVKRDNTILIITGSTWFSKNRKNEYFMDIQNMIENSLNNILLTGYIPNDNLNILYKLAYVTVCPSIGFEAAGLVIIESLSMGTPVIATRIGGIPEYTDTNSCLLVDYDLNFIGNLSYAITKILTDMSLYIRLKKSIITNSTFYNTNDYYLKFRKIIEVNTNEIWSNNIS